MVYKGIENYIDRLFAYIIQHRKVMLVIGLFCVLAIGGGAYVARDYLKAIVLNQQKFLGALFAARSFNESKAEKGVLVNASAPVKECSFETSDKPSRDVVIFTELAWMGNKENANNEWIELKNISSGEIDISGWNLINESEKIKIIFSGDTKILSDNFYLIERGSGDFLPGLQAGAFFAGALKNSGDSFRLFDRNCNLVDEVIAPLEWPAGDNKTKKTMERDAKTLTWHTSNSIGGTPKKENTIAQKVSAPAAEKTVPKVLDAPPVSLFSGADNLLMSEMMVGAESAFIEFYNPSSSAIDMTGWTIKKKTSAGSITLLISASRLKGKIIKPGGYFLAANRGDVAGVKPDVVWPASYTIARTNNAILIYDNLGKKVEEVSWKSILLGKSYQRNAWFLSSFSAMEKASPQSQ